MWKPADVSFDLRDEVTEDPVVTIQANTPDGFLYVMAETTKIGGVLVLRGLHMHGDSIGPNMIGQANLIVLAHAIMEDMEEMNVHELRIEGAVRTTGAGPGHRPRPLRVRRRVRPAAG